MKSLANTNCGCECHATPEPRRFTPQQQKIIACICQGKTNKQIAFEIGRSEKTVKAHVTAIMKALGVSNRTQAALSFTAMEPLS